MSPKHPIKHRVAITAALLLLPALLLTLHRSAKTHPAGHGRSQNPAPAGARPPAGTRQNPDHGTPTAMAAHAANSLKTPLLALTGRSNGLPLKANRKADDIQAGREFEMSMPDLASFSPGEVIEVPLPDGRRLPATVNLSREDMRDTWVLAAGFGNDSGGLTLRQDKQRRAMFGRIVRVDEPIAYTVATDGEGKVWATERWREQLLPACAPPLEPPSAAQPAPAPAPGPAPAPPPILNSKPDAEAVLFIDFDGETATTYPDWPSTNPGGVSFACTDPNFTVQQMTDMWTIIAEDFAPFNINVTTDASRYSDPDAVGRRMRCIVAGATGTVTEFGAGLAWINSFRPGALRASAPGEPAGGIIVANDCPCWVTLPGYPTATANRHRIMADAVAHEFGHTLGLSHDGPGSSGYYPGHGTAPFDWAPIMGNYRGAGDNGITIVQWSKGEYSGATNTEDDLAIISGTANGFGFSSDESTGIISAAPVTLNGSTAGIISSAADFDYFSIDTIVSGSVNLTVTSGVATTGQARNLDVGIELLNSTGTVIATSVPANSMDASISTVVPAGRYYLKVFGSSHLTPSTGYSDYGSIGSFAISGTLPDGIPPTLVIESPDHNSTVGSLAVISGTTSDGSDPSATGVATVGLNIYQNGDYWNGSSWTASQATVYATLNGSGGWSYTNLPTGGNLRTGQYVISAHAIDGAGNTSQAQSGITNCIVTLDQSPPDVAISQPADGSTILGASYLFQGSFDDDQAIDRVVLFIRRNADGKYWNGSGWITEALSANLPSSVNQSNNTWASSGPLPSVGGNPATQLVNGSYNFLAIAIDAAGNEEQTDSVVTVDYHPVYTWTGWTMRDSDPDNNSDSWGTPANWSPYGVPDSADIAVIDNGDTVTSTISRSVHALRLFAGTLHFHNGPGSNGTVTTGTGASEWNGGYLYGIWQNNGALSLGGGGRQLNTSSQLVNAGTVTWQSGVTTGYDSTTITNQAGATWVCAGAGDLFNNFYSGNQFVNAGTLRQTSAGTVDLNDWTYTLGGQIDRQGAVMAFAANGTLANGTSFTGPGVFRLAAGTLTSAGGISNTTGTFEQTDGTFVASAPLTLNGGFLWSGGYWSGNIVIPHGSDLTITAGCQLNTSAVLDNHGTVHWNSPAPLTGYESTTIRNHADGEWRLESAGDVFNNFYSGNRFINDGVLRQTNAGTVYLNDWEYTFGGQITRQAGVLEFNSNGTTVTGVQFNGAGGFRFAGGGLSGSGTIIHSSGTFEQSGGTLTATAPLNLQGSYVWTGGYWNGNVVIPHGSQLSITGGCQLNTSATLDNHGTVKWNSPAPLTGYDSTTIRNHPDGLWRIETSGDVFNNFYSNNQFYNEGVLERSAPSGDVILDDWTYQLSGTCGAAAALTRFHSTVRLLEGAQFTGAGSFQFHGTTVLVGATTMSAPCEVAAGGFTGETNGLLHGQLDWASGTFFGSTRVAAGATLRLTTTGGRTLAGGSALDVSGQLVWLAGDLTGYDAGRIYIRSGGQFAIQGGGAFVNFYSGNRVVIDAGGTLAKTTAGNTTLDWALDVNGSASVSAGTLILNGGGGSAGSFTGSGGVVRFNAGEQYLATGASLSGGIESTGGALLATGAAGGRIDVLGGTVGSTGAGQFNFTGACTWTGGELTGNPRVATGATLATSGPNYKQLNPGAMLVVDGLLAWEGGHPVVGRDSVTIDVHTGGTFRTNSDGDLFANYYGGNRLLVSGTLEKSAGSGETLFDEWLVEGAGVFRPQTGTLRFQTDFNLLPGASFGGSGRTLLAAGTTNTRGSVSIAAGSTVELGGASLTGHADGTGALTGGAIQWTSGWINGALLLDSNTVLAGAAEKVLGAGAHLRNDGVLTFAGTGQLTGWDSSTLRNQQGGTLHATGTHPLGNYYGGNWLINEGLMTIGSSPGAQTVHWNFQQSATGTLAIEVAGPNAATPEFDRLLLGGAVQLAGTLQASRSGGYTPAEDTTFEILTAPGIGGTFNQENTPGFEVVYQPNSITLRATAAGLDYDQWAADHQLAGNDALKSADSDHDGLNNLLEYAFNTDPKLGNPNPLSQGTVNISGQTWLVLRYRVWQDRTDAGLIYQPERSPNLSTWNLTGLVDEADPDAAPVAGSSARRCRVPVAAGRELLRLRVETE
jgi:hypothetical protein